jgi:hypothetical protein
LWCNTGRCQVLRTLPKKITKLKSPNDSWREAEGNTLHLCAFPNLRNEFKLLQNEGFESARVCEPKKKK